MAKKFVFEDEIILSFPRDEVFRFFSKAENLEALTPPWVHFSILTPLPIEMREGALIDYRLKIHGFPLRWRTEISTWDPPLRFVDRQLRGPYRSWVHTHTFREIEGGTLVSDRVEYSVWGGSVVNRLFVRGDVERIFSYRRQALARKFGRDAD